MLLLSLLLLLLLMLMLKGHFVVFYLSVRSARSSSGTTTSLVLNCTYQSVERAEEEGSNNMSVEARLPLCCAVKQLMMRTVSGVMGDGLLLELVDIPNPELHRRMRIDKQNSILQATFMQHVAPIENSVMNEVMYRLIRSSGEI